MGNLRITLAQINVQPNQTWINYEKVEALIHKLSANTSINHPHILLLPELWSTGFTPDLQTSSNLNQTLIQNLQQLSNQKNLIIAGSYINKTKSGDYTNSLKLIIPNMDHINTYDKIHLFSQMNEIEWFKAGKKPVIINYKKSLIGLSICYDLRFPELFRNYANHQVEICLLPAQWPAKRIVHFKNLIQARAIENQLFFAAVNTVGKIGNTMFGGNSMLVDPSGKILTTLSSENEDLITLKINLNDVKKQRNEFPVLTDQTNFDSITPELLVLDP